MMRRPKSITTDFRSPGAGGTSPVGRDYNPQPRAVACPQRKMLDGLSDGAIDGIIQAAERQGNLRDYRDHEKRWWAQRSSVAREIRRERRAAGSWSL